MSNTNNVTKPVYQKRLPKGISSSVFENVHDGRTYRSVNIQRSFRKDNKWSHSSIYLKHEQIPFMIEALKATWVFLNGDLIQTQEAPTEEEQDLDELDEISA